MNKKQKKMLIRIIVASVLLIGLTLVTRLVEADVAIPVIQQLAGHSRSDVTLDVYTTITNEFKMREFDDFQAKMKHQDEEWHRNLLEQKKAENTGEQRNDREEG